MDANGVTTGYSTRTNYANNSSVAKGATMKKWWLLSCLLLVFIFSGCKSEEGDTSKSEEGDTKKISDLSFIVVTEDEVPERLRNLIQVNKEKPFKLTYSDENNLYLVVGYGTQPTCGYSIQVKECYLTSNAIIFKTNLLGPSKLENIVETPSQPYIVVKMEYRDEMVVFQ